MKKWYIATYCLLVIFIFIYTGTNYCNQDKSTILITGGAGYIGSHTGWLLVQKGYEVIILDHRIMKKFPWAHYIEADYADEKVLSDIFSNNNIEAVFHFAAYTLVRDSVNKPLDYYDNNLVKTVKLLDIMMRHGVNKLIFSSSRTVYGNAQFLPIVEDHPKNPISPYGRTKWMIELILQDFHNTYGLKFMSIRFVNATGALPEYGLGEEHDPETHLIPALIKAARKDLPFEIYGGDYDTTDGTCIRSYIHVLDIAYANLAALEYLNKGGKSGFFGLGTDLILSVKETVAAVEKFYNKKINYSILPKKPGDSPELYTDYSRARTALGWEPRYTNIEFILKTIDEFENLKEKGSC